MFKAFKNLNGVDLSKSLKKKRFQVMKLNHLPARTDECKFSFFRSAIFIYNSLIHDQEGVHTSNLAGSMRLHRNCLGLNSANSSSKHFIS